MPFAKAKSGNPKGRPRGALTKSKVLLKELAQAIVGDLQVQNRLFRQARDGSIHPAVLVALFHYAAGKPPPRGAGAPPPPPGRSPRSTGRCGRSRPSRLAPSPPGAGAWST